MSFCFENLQVWQKARMLTKNIYKVTASFPKREDYNLSNQICRAAVSTASNIVEGTSRSSVKEKLHFCEISYASLMEVMCQLILAYDLGFISADTLNEIRADIEEISRMLNSLRNSFRRKLNS